MINRRSFIIGIKSTILNKKEIFFLKKYKPWGIILFKRNIKTIKQTKKLTNHIKKIFNDTKYPILLEVLLRRSFRFSFQLFLYRGFWADFCGWRRYLCHSKWF